MCKYSDIALKTLAIKVSEKPTYKQFYDRYSDRQSILDKYDDDKTKEITNQIVEKFDDYGIEGFVCDKDNDFPVINKKVTPGDKPYLLFYRGNLKLLENLNNNVAVIGMRSPDKDIKNRETKIVKALADKGLNIVSGLADGCDAIAHNSALEFKTNTVAILPSTIQKIIPESNISLANEITNRSGLLVTEYYDEPENSFEAKERFINRDRLQAMFSKSVILIASFEKGKGDSGSRHAMEKAKKYGHKRFVMYDEKHDANKPEFELNKNYYLNENVEVFKNSSSEEIFEYYIADLSSDNKSGEQLKFNF